MAAHSDGTIGDTSTHPAGCGCVGCSEIDASGADNSGVIAGIEVADYTALLYYANSGQDSLRWNGQTDVGTAVVVTYSFTENVDLPPISSDPYGATAYWSYSQAQRDLFDEVTGKYEAVSGVIFVEVQGEAMINVYGSTGGNAGGWANVAQSTSTYTSQGDLTNNYMNMSAGDYGYQVNLHELGHAMGLQHPFEGDITLASSADNQTNTVMTYNIEQPYVTELGIFDVQAMQDIYGTADAVADWDVYLSSQGDVVIKGGKSSDTILAVGDDTVIYANKGNDTVFGREGDDRVRAGYGDDEVFGGQGSDVLFGSYGDDYILGDVTEDPYSGNFSDNDRISGQHGNDILHGGDGDDEIYGGADNDQMHGGYGDDYLVGGKGNDTMYGGDGEDTMKGGNGYDTFVFENADSNEVNYILDFKSGSDTIDLTDFGFFNSVNQFTQNVSGGNMNLSYSSWFDIQFTGFTDTLTDADFNFA